MTMAPRDAERKKRLPKEFETMPDEEKLAKLQALFDARDMNARGGPGKWAALAFDSCPDDLA